MTLWLFWFLVKISFFFRRLMSVELEINISSNEHRKDYASVDYCYITKHKGINKNSSLWLYKSSNGVTTSYTHDYKSIEGDYFYTYTSFVKDLSKKSWMTFIQNGKVTDVERIYYYLKIYVFDKWYLTLKISSYEVLK